MRFWIYKALPKIPPILKIIKPNTKLKKIFRNALSISPFLTKFALSKIKVENVVNAPQKPVIKRSLWLYVRKNVSEDRFATIPIIKHPIKFTVNVPKGKPAPRKW